jgi:hypothetical protein
MSYTQLTREERYVIAHLKVFKLSLREIARRLNRHHSTISRELKRNGPTYPGGGVLVRRFPSARTGAQNPCPSPSPSKQSCALRLRGAAPAGPLVSRVHRRTACTRLPARARHARERRGDLSLGLPRCPSRRRALPLPVPGPQAPAQAAPLRKSAWIDPGTRVHCRAPRGGRGPQALRRLGGRHRLRQAHSHLPAHPGRAQEPLSDRGQDP